MISVLDGQQGAPAPDEKGDDADASNFGGGNALLLMLAVSGCQPTIWRQVVVRENMWLQQLHDVIQIAFDWFDYQTHSFTFGGGTHFGNPSEKEGEESVEDDRDVTLEDIDLALRGELFYYYYFGKEPWCVTITVQKVFPVEKGAPYPVCIAGGRAGPPEDCGGVDAYHDMLGCIKNPHSELGEEWREWLGDEYEPERCDLGEINKLLDGIGADSDKDRGKGKGKGN